MEEGSITHQYGSSPVQTPTQLYFKYFLKYLELWVNGMLGV